MDVEAHADGQAHSKAIADCLAAIKGTHESRGIGTLIVNDMNKPMLKYPHLEDSPVCQPQSCG
jgi:hypothetical protein